MKKKLTLNQTWILCLRMWRWITKEWTGRISVVSLKQQWLKANGFTKENILTNCFFCDFQNNDDGDGSCLKCPGRLVDSGFQCENNAYHYYEKPIAFYKELLRLNRIRKAQK